jgi:hypothetical protein
MLSAPSLFARAIGQEEVIDLATSPDDRGKILGIESLHIGKFHSARKLTKRLNLNDCIMKESGEGPFQE